MRAILRALPDIIRTIGGLALDPVLPKAAKVALAAAILYLVSPIDLIPDFIPGLGYLDDVFVAAILVDGMLNFVNRGLVLEVLAREPGVARAHRALGASPGRLGAPPAEAADLLEPLERRASRTPPAHAASRGLARRSASNRR